MLHIILLSFILLSFCCACWKLWFNENKNMEPPDVSGWLSLIGHGLRLIQGDTNTVINDVSKECLKKGGLATCRIGFEKLYFITDPEAILAISNICLEKHYIYSFIKPVLGDGLITAGVTTWKRNRKLLNPSFSVQVINGLIEIFNDRTRTLVELFSRQLDEPLNHMALIRAWNLETICLTTTGLQSNANNDLRDKYLYHEDKLLHIVEERIRMIWFHIDFIYNMSNLKKEGKKSVKEFIEFSKSIIDKKEREIKTTKPETGTPKTFLDYLLRIKNNCFTDEHIREEVDTIISAGFDTTAMSLNILFLILGSNPDVQQKVFNEVIEVFEKSDRDPDKDDLPKLLFTEAVLKETLRLYPTVPVVARHIDKDITMKNYTLKKNGTCILSIYGLNRNPNWGPDADQFRPERWLDAATLPDHINFGTFSIGKRNCIGKTYAMVFMKIVLVHVIRIYQISADINKVAFKWAITVSPTSGNLYTLKRRDVNTL